MILTPEKVSRESTSHTIRKKRNFSTISHTTMIILIRNGDISSINSKGELCSTINASELCQDYERGKLKGKLKEVAATLEEDDNRVVVLVRPKK